MARETKEKRTRTQWPKPPLPKMTIVAVKGVFGLRRLAFIQNQHFKAFPVSSVRRVKGLATAKQKEPCQNVMVQHLTGDRKLFFFAAPSIVDEIKIVERERPTSALQHICARLFCLSEAGNGGKGAENTTSPSLG